MTDITVNDIVTVQNVNEKVTVNTVYGLAMVLEEEKTSLQTAVLRIGSVAEQAVKAAVEIVA